MRLSCAKAFGEHVLPIVLFCTLSDALLIAAGVGGAGVLIRGNEALMQVTRLGGALFFASSGILAARRARQGQQMAVNQNTGSTLAVALAACFGFTFLNPHVYLDTVVLLGSIANQRPDPEPWVFATGACVASLVWFSALGLGARFFGACFSHRHRLARALQSDCPDHGNACPAAAAERQARKDGMIRLHLTTAKTNAAAQSLYESEQWIRDEMFFTYSKQVGI
jgi:L-lysine exporter family protein LysE/ArgO